MDQGLILLHGFEGDSLVGAVRAIEAVLPDPGSIAFASTTPVNVEWKVGELIEHVAEEHEAFRAARSEPR